MIDPGTEALRTALRTALRRRSQRWCTMQLTKGKLLFANAVAFLALAGLLADTRRRLPVPVAHGRRALAGEEAIGGNDELRSLVEKEMDAALAGMRGELEAARHEGARALANATATLGARVERLERDVDGLRSSRVGGAKKRRYTSCTSHSHWSSPNIRWYASRSAARSAARGTSGPPSKLMAASAGEAPRLSLPLAAPVRSAGG